MEDCAAIDVNIRKSVRYLWMSRDGISTLISQLEGVIRRNEVSDHDLTVKIICVLDCSNQFMSPSYSEAIKAIFREQQVDKLINLVNALPKLTCALQDLENELDDKSHGNNELEGRIKNDIRKIGKDNLREAVDCLKKRHDESQQNNFCETIKYECYRVTHEHDNVFIQGDMSNDNFRTRYGSLCDPACHAH